MNSCWSLCMPCNKLVKCPGCTLPHAQSQLGLDSALLGPLMNKQYTVDNT